MKLLSRHGLSPIIVISLALLLAAGAYSYNYLRPVTPPEPTNPPFLNYTSRVRPAPTAATPYPAALVNQPLKTCAESYAYLSTHSALKGSWDSTDPKDAYAVQAREAFIHEGLTADYFDANFKLVGIEKFTDIDKNPGATVHYQACVQGYAFSSELRIYVGGMKYGDINPLYEAGRKMVALRDNLITRDDAFQALKKCLKGDYVNPGVWTVWQEAATISGDSAVETRPSYRMHGEINLVTGECVTRETGGNDTYE